MDDQLNRLLLETSGDPERITDLLQAIAIELSESSEAAGTMVEPVLENFYLAMNLAAKLCQTTADKSRLEAIVENMPMAMLIVSPEKIIQAANLRARHLLDTAEFIAANANKLSVLNSQSRDQLAELFKQYSVIKAQPLSPAAFNLASLSGDSIVQGYLYQQNRYDFELRKHVVDLCVLFNDNQTSFDSDCINSYIKHYKLSGAEAFILHALVAGKSLNQIANERFVSIHTVRTQVKTMLRKTETSRQNDMVQRALAFVAVVSDNASGLPRINESSLFTLKDGRQLAYFDSGGDFESVIVHCHGMFTCRLDPLEPETFAAAKVRLIIPDRPGYGLSDPVDHCGFTDWADDLIELMDGLSIHRFSIMAGDFSSAYALAVAYKQPHRVDKVLLLEGAAPVDADLTQYEADIPAYYRATFFAVRKLPKLVYKASYVAYSHFSRDPGKALNRFLDIIGEDNCRVIRKPDIYAKLSQAVAEASRQGVVAIASNQVLMFSDWKFPIHGISNPVLMVVGEADPLARYHKVRLQQSLSNTTVISVPGKGWAGMMYEEMPTILQQWQRL